MKRIFHFSMVAFFVFGLISKLEAIFTSRSQADGDQNGYQYGGVVTTGGALQGFLNFSEGLTLNADSIWSAEGGVNGALSFASNTLTLSNAMHIGPSATISGTTYVRIDGGGNYVVLTGDNTTLSTPWQVKNTALTLDGLGHSLTLPDNIFFIPSGDGSFALANMTLINQNTHFMLSNFTPSNMTLRNITIKNPAGSTGWLFDGSSTACGVTISGDVRIEGPGSGFAFASKITIAANSSLYIGPDVTVSRIGVSSGGGAIPVGITMTDSTSVLYLDGCKFYTGVLGTQVVKGTVMFGNKVRVFNCNVDNENSPNTTMANGFILGDGTAANDVEVRVLGGAYVEVAGCMQYKHS